LRSNPFAQLAGIQSIADWAMCKRNNGRGQTSVDFLLAFPLDGLRNQRPAQTAAAQTLQVDSVWISSGFGQTRRLAFVRIDESFSPIALSTYIDARMQSKGFRPQRYVRAA
jgi:hypothetical protein